MTTDQLTATIRQPEITIGKRTLTVPALIAATGKQAVSRFRAFFAAAIRNPNTGWTYGRAVADFLAWCADQGVSTVAAVQPVHVAAWIEQQTRLLSASTAQVQLGAIRRLFDWLMTGKIVPSNPARSVRVPFDGTRSGTPAQACQWICVYANARGEGAWDLWSRTPVHLATLPISGPLRDQLRRWNGTPLPTDTAALEAFAAEGLAIAKALKAELPAYLVNYYDEAAAARNTEDDCPRDDHPDPWDYEIE